MPLACRRCLRDESFTDKIKAKACGGGERNRGALVLFIPGVTTNDASVPARPRPTIRAHDINAPSRLLAGCGDLAQHTLI